MDRLGPPDGGRNRARTSAGLPPPLMTYKSFVMTLPDDLEPSKFQSLYEEYQGMYLTDFSNAFFHISKTEEWFQERYNPCKIKERDINNATWATSESALFRDQLLENAGKTVRNLRLGRLAGARSCPLWSN